MQFSACLAFLIRAAIRLTKVNLGQLLMFVCSSKRDLNWFVWLSTCVSYTNYRRNLQWCFREIIAGIFLVTMQDFTDLLVASCSVGLTTRELITDMKLWGVVESYWFVGLCEEAFSSGARTKQLESLVDDKEASGWLHEWYHQSHREGNSIVSANVKTWFAPQLLQPNPASLF